MQHQTHFKRTYLLVLIGVIGLFLGSCNKDDFDASKLEKPVWQPEIAFPLVYTELHIGDLVHATDSNTTIITDPDQFCTLIYQGRAFELGSNQLVSLPDQGFQRSIFLTNNQILTLTNTGQVTISKSQNADFNFGQGIEIDSVNLKTGNLSVNFSSDFPDNGILQITIPGLVKNGSVFTTQIPINYQGTLPVTYNSTISIEGYHLDMTANGTLHNRLKIDYQLTLQGSASGVTTGNSITMNSIFNDLNYSSVFGYVGQQSLTNIKDTVEITLFNNSIGTGSFTIADPKIRFDINNSLGIPFQARISSLTAVNGNLTDFTVANGIPDPLPLLSPGINQIGQTLHSSINLDKSNSNATTMIAQQPKYLISQTQTTTNPNGHGINFVTDSSKLTIDMYVELPFFGTANNFRIRDTVPFSYNDLANVESLTLRTAVENQFPLEASLQLVFMDENMHALDTLFLPGEVVIPSGIVDAVSGRVTIPGEKQADHVMDRNRITKILNAKSILVNASSTSYNNGLTNVKIYADYALKVKIGAIAKMKIQ